MTAPATFQEEGGPQVTVTRDGDHLNIDYRFGRDVPVWAFQDSALEQDSRQPWRPRQWTVETPGVVMERRGHYDIIRSTDGGPVPREVRFRVRPQAVDLEAEYPTLLFSNGAVALPTRQLDVFALPSAKAAEQVPDDLNRIRLDGGPSRVTWRDENGPVLFNGRRRDELTTTDERSYVLLGEATVTPGTACRPSWTPICRRGSARRSAALRRVSVITIATASARRALAAIRPSSWWPGTGRPKA